MDSSYDDRFVRFSMATESLAKTLQKYKNDCLEPFGLRSMHLMTLWCLWRNGGGLTAGELSRLCSVDKAFVSRVTGELGALAGAAVGCVYGLTPEEIRKGIESYQALAGRFRIIRKGSITVIDDCYNANPASVKASLTILGGAAGRKVAVLGDMGELGEKSDELHAGVGREAAAAGIDALYCAGPHMKYAADTAAEGVPEVRHFDTAEELLAALPELIQSGDTVLVKASHFMGFDRAVACLTE